MAHDSYVGIPIQTKLYRQVLAFLDKEGVDKDPNLVIEQFIEYGLDNASWKKDDFFPELSAAPSDDLKGYNWGPIFLPHGTMLRMKYKGHFHYAKVIGDQVIFEEKPISPSALANTIAKSARNAWRDFWIRRPRDSDWSLADDMRRTTYTQK